MILITKTTAGLLIQRDATEIAIDGPAVSLALGPIIKELIDNGRAIASARLDSYNRGLEAGREQMRIEMETSARIAEARALDLAETLESAHYVLAV
jgi:hypothetical protein